jgi:mannosyltransferase OCH1-like enzyme
LKKREIESFNENHIPKIIWSYWDNPEVPDFVTKCRKNWVKFAPNYEIRYLNKNNIENYITNMPENWQNLPPYRQADILRLKLLEKYGGIWMDASILLLENPDKFVGDDITLFITPITTNADPIYENWFIASTPNNEIIKKWVVEVEKALKNPEVYIESSSEYNKKLVNNPEYLICHLALRNIYDNHKDIFKNGKYIDSNTTAFYEHNKYSWKDVAINAFKDFSIHPERLMIKFISVDRNHINEVEIPAVLIA